MKDSSNSKLLTKFRFTGRVSRMGKTEDGRPNKIIWIPKELHDSPLLKKLEGKQLIIQLDDEI
jgi:hypothetical protein